MSRSIIFDTGPIINLALNNLLWTLDPLKKKFNGDFIIPAAVKKEVIDRPLSGKKYKFESMQVLNLVGKGILTVTDDPSQYSLSAELLGLANTSFWAHGSPIQLLHAGEISVISTAILRDAEAIVVDERTAKELIEHPIRIEKILRHKLHTRVSVNQRNLKAFHDKVKKIKILRSCELVVMAYELGLLDNLLFDGEEKIVSDVKRELLEGVLWAIKLNGCAISSEEISKIIKFEGK